MRWSVVCFLVWLQINETLAWRWYSMTNHTNWALPLKLLRQENFLFFDLIGKMAMKTFKAMPVKSLSIMALTCRHVKLFASQNSCTNIKCPLIVIARYAHKHTHLHTRTHSYTHTLSQEQSLKFVSGSKFTCDCCHTRLSRKHNAQIPATRTQAGLSRTAVKAAARSHRHGRSHPHKHVWISGQIKRSKIFCSALCGAKVKSRWIHVGQSCVSVTNRICKTHLTLFYRCCCSCCCPCCCCMSTWTCLSSTCELTFEHMCMCGECI